MLPSLFAALTMLSVGRSAQAIMFETRRQFQACPDLKLEENKGKQLKGSDGKMYPDSAKCVEIATASAIKEMVVPGVLAVFTPVVVGFLLTQKGLAGLLMGALSSGFMVSDAPQCFQFVVFPSPLPPPLPPSHTCARAHTISYLNKTLHPCQNTNSMCSLASL